MVNNDCPTCRHLVWHSTEIGGIAESVEGCSIYMDNEGPADHCSRFEAKTSTDIERDIQMFRRP